MLFWKVRTEPFAEAKTARKGLPVFLTMLLAGLLFIGFRYGVAFLTEKIYKFVQNQVSLYKLDAESSILYDMGLIIHASATLVLVLLASLYVRFLEGRRLATMGFHRDGSFKNVLKGAITGVLLYAAILGVLVFSGNYKFEGELRTDLLARVAGILSVLICGVAFEYYFRGFLLSSLGSRCRTLFAVLLTAVLSTAAHSYYWGYSLLSIFNSLLFDILLGVLVVRTGSAYTACAARACFLFVCQFVFGTAYAGAAYAHAFVPTTVNYASLWVGTVNGIDSGWTFMLILAAALLLALFLPKKPPEDEWESGPFFKHVPVGRTDGAVTDAEVSSGNGKDANAPGGPAVLQQPEGPAKEPAAQSGEPGASVPPQGDDEEDWEEEEARVHVEPDYKKPEDYLK